MKNTSRVFEIFTQTLKKKSFLKIGEWIPRLSLCLWLLPSVYKYITH